MKKKSLEHRVNILNNVFHFKIILNHLILNFWILLQMMNFLFQHNGKQQNKPGKPKLIFFNR